MVSQAQTKTVTVTNPSSSASAGGGGGGGGCIRRGCGRPSVRNIEWEDEYCSNQCVVLHCEAVFSEWVAEQNKQG